MHACKDFPHWLVFLCGQLLKATQILTYIHTHTQCLGKTHTSSISIACISIRSAAISSQRIHTHTYTYIYTYMHAYIQSMLGEDPYIIDFSGMYFDAVSGNLKPANRINFVLQEITARFEASGVPLVDTDSLGSGYVTRTRAHTHTNIYIYIYILFARNHSKV